MAIGFTLPFARSTGSLGYLQTTATELEATAHNLRSLILTNWGERVTHYNLGCNLREFIFDPRTLELKEKIADRLLSQVAAWLPFVSIDDLQILFDKEAPSVPKNGILIRIKFSLLQNPGNQMTLNLPVSP